MKPDELATLKTVFDSIEEEKGEEEFMSWAQPMLDAKLELGEFVAKHRGRGAVRDFVEPLKGSFNLSFRFGFEDDGPDAIIRFPKPGHIAPELRDEKVTNEVRVMEYLRENTSLPIPRVIGWGTTVDSPRQLGPFIIMEYVQGTLLSDLLRDPNVEDEVILDPEIDNDLLDTIYRQMASFVLELSHLRFTRIGALCKTSGSYSVSTRPLTYNMNELASVATYPVEAFPTTPFESVSEYMHTLADEHMRHLWTQRNLATTDAITRSRYIARHQLGRLIDVYTDPDADDGPFIPFCEDLRPSNMLVDPDTLQITAVLDLEFTNAMPAQFSRDPPWWLLLSGPEVWLDQGAIADFNTLYQARMDQFITQLRIVEDEELREQGINPDDPDPTAEWAQEKRLSEHMLDSWESGRFWFDYAARRSFDLDVVYWGALHVDGEDDDPLDEDARGEMEGLVLVKRKQLAAYNEECRTR